MIRFCILLVLSLFYYSTESQNLVHNPSFEEVYEVTNRWSGTFSVFNRRIKYWNSPTQGSPDILYIESLGKMHPKRPKVDLTKYRPRTGKFMVGIKTYGCETNTLHCKEYLQMRLKEPLQAGRQYVFEYWVCPINTSVKVNSFGLTFTMERMKDINQTGLIDLYPIVMDETLIDSDSLEWQQITGVFTADDAYEHMIIGNFSPDRAIEHKVEPNGLDYGYYLLDDVMVRPLDPNSQTEIKTNEVIVLENILFEFDQSILQDSSKPSLDQLVAYLQDHPSHHIDIMGHTDAKGSAAYNLQLSQERAQTIATYLADSGVEMQRINPMGLGSQYPLVDNDRAEGRKLNRRVEVRILEEMADQSTEY